jgi:Mn2+/Fe2+ NRAMP family transporter
MIFYQQAAIADKKLRPDDLKAARWDTAVGTVLTQCLTGAVLIAAAATLASSGVSANLSSCLFGCFSLSVLDSHILCRFRTENQHLGLC